MQNPYAVERFIQEHNVHARAVAELQALQRQALRARRRETWAAWRWRLNSLLGRPAIIRRPAETRFAQGPTEVPFAPAGR